MDPAIGIGILAYERLADVQRCVTSIYRNTTLPFECMVFDNSEHCKEIRKWLLDKYPKTVYLTMNKNVGCTVSRNQMYQTFLDRHPEAEFLCIMDMDVVVQPGWLEAMVKMMQDNPQCGSVGWPAANFPHYKPLKNGCVQALAGMCLLHRVAALKDVVAHKLGKPWDDRFFFFRFDSLLSDRMNQVGWRSHLLPHNLVVHHHPHQGVRTNPRWKQIQRNSQRLYLHLQKTEGWKPFDPFKEPY